MVLLQTKPAIRPCRTEIVNFTSFHHFANFAHLKRPRCILTLDSPPPSYSIDRLAVVLSDVDSDESTFDEISEERRMTPSAANDVFLLGETKVHLLFHTKTREDHAFQLGFLADECALLSEEFLLVVALR